jgi:hypothetical protein
MRLHLSRDFIFFSALKYILQPGKTVGEEFWSRFVRNRENKTGGVAALR